MKIITPSSPNRSSDHDTLFEQGAKGIACDGPLSAGLWFGQTPVYQGQNIGTIGECQLEDSPRAIAFIADCADYLHYQCGCNTIVGPMNGNTWSRHRLILESDDRDSFLMEPVEPENFHATFEAAGFSILSQYTSSLIDLHSDQADFSFLEKRMKQGGISFRCLDVQHFEKDLLSIFHLSLLSFANNFLYTPLPQTTFLEKYQSSKEHIDPDLVLLAEHEGELIGYVFCMPDLLASQYNKKPAIIVKTLATKPGKGFSGLGTLLVSKVQQRARAKGYQEAIHALQYESNSSLRISQRFNARVFRRYALMAKIFPHTSQTP